MTAVMNERKRQLPRFHIVREKGRMPPVDSGEIDQAVELINCLWTDADIMRVFGISYPTCIIWRRDRDLPYKVIQGDQRPSIRYVPAEVIRWGRRNGKEMNLSSK